MIDAAAVMAEKIGRCDSCQNLFCEKPKMKKLHPEEGCSEWSTAESRAIKNEPVWIVSPVMD